MKGKITYDPSKKRKIISLEDGNKQELGKKQFKKDVLPGQEIIVDYDIVDGEIKIRDGKKQDYVGAPYNFIPLNVSPINGQIPPQSKPNEKGETESIIFSKFFPDPEYYSGLLTLNIHTKTPFFIRGEKENMILVNNQPAIPGSSLRGLTRSLVEIISFGKFLNYNNRVFYYRSTIEDQGEIIAGFLKQDDDENYSIQPAKYERIINNNDKKDIKLPHVYKIRDGSVYFSTGEFSNMLTIWKFTRLDSDPVPVSKNIIDSYIEDEQRDEDIIDMIKTNRFSNVVNKKKKIIPGNEESLEKGVPVFYRVNENNDVISFGHAKYYRVPYNHDVANFVHSNLNQGIDFAESIFGYTFKDKSSKEKQAAGKIFFEDALLKSKIDDVFLDIATLKVLGGPKPTTYQHYLKQPPGKKAKNTWSDKKGEIRGYKLYWHRNTSEDANDDYSWKFNTDDKTDYAKMKKVLPDEIKPIKPEIEFFARIRFENLTAEELGCLLSAIKLPPGCCHKLGMGKPLGLGSIEISPTLVLHNKAERYKNLFDEKGNWNQPVINTDDSPYRIEDFKKKFEDYILGQLYPDEKNGKPNFWKIPRMNELKTMLTFDHEINNEKWIEATRYMEIKPKDGSENEFKKRSVLPEPSETVELVKK